MYLPLPLQTSIRQRLLVHHPHQLVIILHINPIGNQLHRPLKVRRLQPLCQSDLLRKLYGGDPQDRGEERGQWHVALQARHPTT